MSPRIGIQSPIIIALIAAIGTASAHDGVPSQPIAFTLKVGNENHVAVINEANGTVSDIATCGVGECYPSWSPDGAKITFERHDDKGASIYIMQADGTNQRRLSPIPGSDVRPSFSPDGTQILFNRVIDASSHDGVPATDIMLMNVDGTDRHAVLPGNGSFNVEPRFSPDGKKITFMSNRRGGQHIYVMNANGSGITQITNKGSNGDPSWSPDGSRISFGSNREGGGRLNIFTTKPDGSDIIQLTYFVPPAEAGDTGWSPDGKMIAFEMDIDGKGQSDPNAFAEIWAVPSDGSAPPSNTHQSCSAVGCAPRYRPN